MNESGYVSDTSGGGRVGGNGMSEYNIHTPQVATIKPEVTNLKQSTSESNF